MTLYLLNKMKFNLRFMIQKMFSNKLFKLLSEIFFESIADLNILS